VWAISSALTTCTATCYSAVHCIFGELAFAIAVWVGRVRRATPASGWAERGLDVVRLLAFVVSATAVVEGIGAYPPLDVLHNIVYVNVVALLVLLLGFLFIAAVGVGRLLRGERQSGLSNGV
jgi:hypothetical protein